MRTHLFQLPFFVRNPTPDASKDGNTPQHVSNFFRHSVSTCTAEGLRAPELKKSGKRDEGAAQGVNLPNTVVRTRHW